MAGDRGEDAVLAALRCALQGHDLFARLGLPAEATRPALVRQRYIAAARIIHPDKTSDPSAKDAFQRISEAFDKLYDAKTQKEYLDSLEEKKLKRQRAQALSKQRRAEAAEAAAEAAEAREAAEALYEAVAESDDECQGPGGDGDRKAWWDIGWADFERRLREREAQERQREAVDAAMEAGEDPLDAFMVSLAQEESRPQAPPRSPPIIPHKETKASGHDVTAFHSTKKRKPEESSTSGGSGFRGAFFQRTSVRLKKEAADEADSKNQVTMGLVTGMTISVGERQSVSARQTVPGVLDHLESDGSEIED